MQGEHRDRREARLENFPDAGNRAGKSDADPPIVIARNRSDLYDLTSESPNNANGDLTSKADSTGTTTYEYDALGNLRKVTPPTGSAIEYVVDGANRRVGKKVGGTLVQQWLFNGDLRVVAELDGAGVVTGRFVYGTRINIPEYAVRGGVNYRIVTDETSVCFRQECVMRGPRAGTRTRARVGAGATDGPARPGTKPSARRRVRYAALAPRAVSRAIADW